MRHFFCGAALGWQGNGDTRAIVRRFCPIPGHPRGMHAPTSPALLPAPTRAVHRLAARLGGAIAVAVDLSAVAAAAHDNRAAAPRAHEQTARPRGALPVIAAAA